MAAGDAQGRDLSGWLYALGAYLAWGLSPIYFRSVGEAPALEIVAHRVVWAVLFLLLLLGLRGRLAEVLPALRRPGAWRWYALTSVLIGGNWLLFIWAVNSGRILEASLGYYINPLVNVLLGVAFLRESLTRRQWLAVSLAGIGVAIQVLTLGAVPWIALALASSFGIYGLIRKRAGAQPLSGLLIETTFLLPAALALAVYLAWSGQGAFLATPRATALLPLAGAVTAIPLVWFLHGANRLPLSTLGVLQYLGPTLHFVLAIAVYDEPFRPAQAVTFGFIWASLLLYTWDALARRRALPPDLPVPATAR
jgi:chloramphenicol-sensitive protein RarD